MIHPQAEEHIMKIFELTGAGSMALTFGKGDVGQFFNTQREEPLSPDQLDDIKIIYMSVVAGHPRLNAIRRLIVMLLEEIEKEGSTTRDTFHPSVLQFIDYVNCINPHIEENAQQKREFTGRWKEKEPMEEGDMDNIDEINDLLNNLEEGVDDDEEDDGEGSVV